MRNLIKRIRAHRPDARPSRKKRESRRSLFEFLEPRIVLDAEPLNVIAHLHGKVDPGSSTVLRFKIDSDDFVSSRGTQVLGFRVDPAEGSLLDPAAAEIRDSQGNAYPLNFTSHDLRDATSSLIVAELVPGAYTLKIGSQHQTTGWFDVSVSLAGDIDGDGQVLLNDRSALIGLLRARAYAVEADVNLDGYLTSFDSGHLLRNLGVSTTIEPLTLAASLNPGAKLKLEDGTKLTDVSAQMLAGQTNPAAFVQIDVNRDGTPDIETTADSTGAFTSPVTLVEGNNSIHVMVSDGFGQSAETVIDVALDTTPPTLSLGLSPDSDTEPVGDGQTTFPSVDLEGVTEPGLSVTLFRDGDLISVVDTVTADGSGDYRFNGQALSLGGNLFTAIVSDALGNSTQVNLEVTRAVGDDSGPKIQLALLVDSGVDNADRITNDPRIEAGLNDQSQIVSVKAALDRDQPGSFMDVSSLLEPDGKLSLNEGLLETLLESTLDDGAYTLRMEATDEFGNRSSKSLPFLLDRTAPSTSIATPTDGTITNVNVAVSGQVTDDVSGVASLESNKDGGSFSPVGFDSAGNFQFETAPPVDSSEDGEHTITLRATDVAGNVNPLSTVTYVLDTIAPTGTVSLAPASDTGEEGDNATSLGQVTIEGVTEAGMEVILQADGRTTTSDASGRFSFGDVSLAPGNNTVEVKLVDAAGNEGSASTAIVREEARLVEGQDFTVLAEFPLTVPAIASHVQLTYADLFFDESDSFINDAFEIALVDDQGRSLVHTIEGSAGAVFNLTEGEPVLLGLNTLQDGQIVKIDLTHAPAGTQATLVARLVNNDADTTTSVSIQSIEVVDGSLGTPASGASKLESPQADSEIDFTRLVDVTASLSLDYGVTSYHANRGELLTDVAVSNDGTFAVDGPLIVVIDNLSDTTVRARDFDGVTPDGKPYYDFTSELTDNTLAAELQTASRQISFFDPYETQFSFTLTFLAKLNAAPTITTEADVEAIVSKLYTYDVEATDADADTLLFALVVAPEGMTIEGSTGIIEWAPGTEDLGNHSVVVQVQDGRGGVAQQTYTLEVIEPPPNRPPVVTSVPVVAAAVGTQYLYEVEATDVDSDPLEYSLSLAPQGMTIDPVSGAIEWQPDVHDLNIIQLVHTLGDRDFFGFESGEIGDDVPNWDFDNREPDDPAFTDFDARIPNLFRSQGEVNLEWTHDLAASMRGQAITRASITLAIGSIEDASPVLQDVDDRLFIEGIEVPQAFDNLDQGSAGTGLVNFELSPTQIASFRADGLLDVRVEGGFETGTQLGYNEAYFIDYVTLTIEAEAGGQLPIGIQVVDGRGGVATQDFKIEVLPDPGNQPPLIISSPVTEVVLKDPSPASPTNYSGVEFPLGDLSFADRVVSYQPGVGAESPNDQPANAIGPPDYDAGPPEDPTTFVALGEEGGSLVVEFVDNYLIDQDEVENGLDLYVFEVGALEAFRTEISVDGHDWIDLGVFSSQPLGIDIKPYVNPGDLFRFVRLTDALDGSETQAPLAGADIDAVGAIGSRAVRGSFRYDVDALDPDGDAISYSLVESPEGMAIDEATGLITWRPEQIRTTVAHYRFEEGPDGAPLQVAVDSGPNGLDGNIIGNLSYTSDTDGTEASSQFALNATSDFDFVSVPDNPRLHFDGSFFVSARVRPRYAGTVSSDVSGVDGIVAKSNTTDAGLYLHAFYLNYDPDAKQFRAAIGTAGDQGERVTSSGCIDDGGASVCPAGATTFDDGAWYDVEMTYVIHGDEATLSLFVDGVLEGSKTFPAVPLFYGDQPLYIGAENAATPDGTGFFRRNFIGDIDEVRIGTIDATGSEEVTVRATDGRGGQDEQSFTIHVLPPEENRDPIIVSEPVTKLYLRPPDEGDSLYQYDVDALDPNGDTIRYSLAESPGGMAIDETTGLITWNPEEIRTTVAHYRFEEGPDGAPLQVAVDSGPNGLNGNIIGNLSYTSDTDGTEASGQFALNATADFDFVSVPDDPRLHLDGSFFVNARVRPRYDGVADNGASSLDGIVGKSNTTDVGLFLHAFYLSYDPDVKQFKAVIGTGVNQGQRVTSSGCIDDGGYSVCPAGARTFDDGEWYEVEMTYVIHGAEATLSLFVDGVLEESKTFPAAPLNYGDQPLYIGALNAATPDGTGFFRRNFFGDIDEVHIGTIDATESEQVTVHATDGRGGQDEQTFTIEVIQPGTGEIRGSKFHDVDGDGEQLGSSVIAGPVVNPTNGHTYYLLDHMSWSESEQEAIQLGGHLVTIDDAAENAFVLESFRPTAIARGGTDLWTGLNDLDVRTDFRWVEGTPVGYTNWAPGQPDSLNRDIPDENYGAIYLSLPGSSWPAGVWHDIVSDTRLGNVAFAVVEVPSTTNYEPGIEAWTIYVDENNNAIRDPGERFTTTDENGEYAFTGLREGTYVIREEHQSGWRQTSPEAGHHEVVLDSGEIVSGIDFGNQPLPAGTGEIRGTKFSDDNGDGNWAQSMRFLGPTHYLSFDDSPFQDIAFSQFYLEDFEDGLLNVPGVEAIHNDPTGRLAVVFPSPYTDSVDADDGVIDGDGREGHSFADADNRPISDVGYTFRFDSQVLGRLPTHVGIALTDGSGNVAAQMEVYGPGEELLGIVGPEHVMDPQFAGETEEDHFFGVVYGPGIHKIVIRNPGGMTNLEVDHLQYGITSEEPGLDGWTIYIDENDNAIRDPGERFTTTDENGNYAFTGLVDRTYIVREELQAGWIQTSSGGTTEQELYAAGIASFGPMDIYRIDNYEDSPQAVTIGVTGVPLGDIAIDPMTGEAFGITATGLYSVDLTTGSTTLIGEHNAGGLNSLEFASDGQLYAMSYDSTYLYRLDPTTGTATEVFDTGYVSLGDLAFETDEIAYLANLDQLVRLDLATESAAVVGPLSPPSMAGLDFDVHGRLYGGLGTDGSGIAEVYEIDKASATTRLIGAVAGASDTGLVGMSFGAPQIAHVAGTTDYELTISGGSSYSGVDFGNQFVGIKNEAPQFESVPPASALADSLYRYEAAASDPNNDPLTFDLVVKPDGMVVDPESGIVAWRPSVNQLGTHDVLLRVSDGQGGVDLQPFQVTVATSRPPIITSNPVNEASPGVPYQYQVRASDPDGDVVHYRLDRAPSGMIVDADTGLIRWDSPSASAHLIIVTAFDDAGAESSQSYSLAIVSSPNLPPEFQSTPRSTVQLGKTYRYIADVLDPNHDPLSFILDEAPTGLEISTAGVVTWTPTAAQFGIAHPVTIRVEDGRGGSGLQTFSIEVVNHVDNEAPEIVSNPVTSARIDRLYAYDVVAQDNDNDPLVFELAVAPIGMTIDPVTGQLRWIPSRDQRGTHEVSIDVFDGQGGSARQSFAIDVRSNNTPPLIVSVPPTQAFVGKALQYAVVANDADGDKLEFLKAGPPNMSIDPGTGLLTWTPDAGQVGTHTIGVRASDGELYADQWFDIVVALSEPNQPPNIDSTPAFLATINEPYQYDVDATDPNGETPSYVLLDAPAGMQIDSVSGLITWVPGQLGSVPVAVAAVDGFGAGAVQRYTLTILETNNDPTINSPPVERASVGRLYRYDVRANDPDGDPLVYSLIGQPTGMTIDSRLGQIRWSPESTDAGSYSFDVEVSDGRGGIDAQRIKLVVGPDESAPRVTLTLDPSPVDVGGTVTILVSAVDDIKVTSLSLTVDGVVVPLDRDGRAVVQADSIGVRSVVATAADPSGNVGEASEQLLIRDPSDVNAPTVRIDVPADGETITSPTDVIGTVTDDNLLSYTLSYAAYGSGDFTEIVTGTEAIIDGAIGHFDPTLLVNGSYVVRLEATDIGGATSVAEQVVEVAGELKIGNFALSFTDLSIPVSGIPITVSRTYDSLTSGQQDDLGYGWRLEFRDTDLRTSVLPTGLEEEFIYNPLYDRARVYVTLPGGIREGFTFRLKPAPGYKGSILGVWRGSFEPDAGVTSELSVRPIDLRVTEFGEALDYASNLPFNPANRLFGGTYTLTTSDGIQYNIDGNSGDLNSVTDRNGNTLTFSDSGITSSTGKSVTFERDARGRISAVIDPMGGRIEYGYDSAGDLVSVTDREGNVTRFVYDEPDYPHFLTEVIDALGRTGVRSDYDDSGRLIKTIDADGNEIQLVHDLDNSIETIIDQRGFATTFEYDELGNVVRETDALGHVTLRAYADPFNPTLETSITDPLGHTTEYTYDRRGNLLTEIDPLGNVTRTTYGSYGEVLTTTDPLGNTTTNSYEASGNLLSIVDAGGMTTSFTYDASGNPLTMSLPGGNTQTFEYDSAGNVRKQTDALGVETSFTYDANGNQLTETTTQTTPTGVRTLVTTRTYDADGRVRTVTDAEGYASITEYDPFGNRVATTDPLGRTTRFVYDDRGLLMETIYPDGTPDDLSDNPRMRTEYDAAGNEIAQIDQLGHRTQFVYDALGRQTETIYPDATPDDDTDNPRTKTEYDAAGQVKAQIDERGNRTEFEYDAAGRQTVVRDALGYETITTFDAAGRQETVTDALGHVTEFVYDATGRPTTTVYADGTSTSSDFDDAGRLASRTDQLNRTTDYEYDKLGRLTAVILPEVTDPSTGQRVRPRTEYDYDERGNLIRQTDAEGRSTLFEYDGLGRRTANALPLGQRSTSVYDPVGNVVQSTDFNGDTIRYDYDEENQLVSKQFPDGTSVIFTYTPLGQRETVTDDRGVTMFAYDERGRLESRTDPDGAAISYTYDIGGNRTSVTTSIPTNAPRVTTYTFDALNRTETVTDPEGGVTSYTYNEVGLPDRTDFPNGTFEQRQYDNLNRLTYLENRNGNTGEVINSFLYELDNTGNRIAVDEHDGRRVEYAYDELYRLIDEDIFDPGATSVSRSISYEYDGVGNRLSRNDTGEGVTTYTYDDNDRLLTETLAGDVTRYEYDDNGNTLRKINNATDEVLTEYYWDHENRLIAADTDGDGTIDVESTYDFTGIRVSQTLSGFEKKHLIDANRPFKQVLEEYTLDGIIVVSYVHGNDLISQNRPGDMGRSFYHVDGLGSTKALSNDSGTTSDRYVYDSFGRNLSQLGFTQNVHLFAGEVRDYATGLDQLRARYLDASIGRFVARDSFEGIKTHPQSLHKYTYADLNPTNEVDPTGNLTLGGLLKGLAISIAVANLQLVTSRILANTFQSATIAFDAKLYTVERNDAMIVSAPQGGFFLTAESQQTTKDGRSLEISSWGGFFGISLGFGLPLELPANLPVQLGVSFGTIKLPSALINPFPESAKNIGLAGSFVMLDFSVNFLAATCAPVSKVSIGFAKGDFSGLGFTFGAVDAFGVETQLSAGYSVPLGSKFVFPARKMDAPGCTS